MSSQIPSFQVPSFWQIPVPVLIPPSNKPSEKDDCWIARTEDIALPIIASLVGFVFLPVKIAVAITFVVTVGAILYYNDCLGCSSEEPAEPKKDVQRERESELLKKMSSSWSVASKDPEVNEILAPGEVVSVKDSSKVESRCAQPGVFDEYDAAVRDSCNNSINSLSECAQPGVFDEYDAAVRDFVSKPMNSVNVEALGTEKQDGTVTASAAKSQSSPVPRSDSLGRLPSLDEYGPSLQEEESDDKNLARSPTTSKLTVDISLQEIRALESPLASPRVDLPDAEL